ncbi:hypothetical protein [Phreatobacter stygius]|uniref:hypothetical protein n=1 Tax=Phreatobacter stygius TaxID=1940610 RepID=UPI001477675B|nr:hypothetical protein [Phreatobacter stygius]
MQKKAALVCAVLSLITLAGCAQNQAAQQPVVAVTNATPPPLPPDPALGQPAAPTTPARRRR